MVGQKLRAMAYGSITGEALADVIATRAHGPRAKINKELGWHKTLSNMAVAGVVGLGHRDWCCVGRRKALGIW